MLSECDRAASTRVQSVTRVADDERTATRCEHYEASSVAREGREGTASDLRLDYFVNALRQIVINGM